MNGLTATAKFQWTATYTLSIILVMEGGDFRKIRKQLDLTQAEFAELIGVKPNTLARWERGVLPISKTIALLAQLLEQQHSQKKRRGADHGLHPKKKRKMGR